MTTPLPIAPDAYDRHNEEVTRTLIDERLGVVEGIGSSFYQSGTGAVTRSWLSKARDIISPLDFGAVGDGTNDDTAELQAAITYAATLTSATGPFVEVDGAGRTYALSAAVVMTSCSKVVLTNCKLKALSGMASTTPLIRMGSGGDLFLTTGCGLRDVHLDCATYSTGVWANGSYQCFLENVTGEHFPLYGVRVSGSNPELRITNCDMKQFRFGDTGYDTYVNRTAYGFYVDSSDVMMFGCSAAYGLVPLYVGANVGGFKDVGSHYYNGRAIPTSRRTPNNTANNGSGLIRVTTSTAHGRTTGDKVIVAGINGTTEARGVWTITVVDSTNFDLDGSTFASAWAASPNAYAQLYSEDVVSCVVETGAASVYFGDCEFDNGTLLLKSASVQVDGTFFLKSGTTGYNAFALNIETSTASDALTGLRVNGRMNVSGAMFNTGFNISGAGSFASALQCDIHGVVDVATGNQPAFGPWVLDNGSAAAPSLVFSGFPNDRSVDADTGLYQPAANEVALATGGTGRVTWTSTAYSPVSNDGNALGTTSLGWSDVHLATGAVINANNGNATITHSAGLWTFNVPIVHPSYTVATLPATATAGATAYASDGRKNGEGAGVGTGVLVFGDGTAWRACDTGATVAA